MIKRVPQAALLVLVPAWTVGVPVSKLLLGSRPNARNRNIEVQGLTSQRMVSIEHNTVGLELDNAGWKALPLVGLKLNYRPHSDCIR